MPSDPTEFRSAYLDSVRKEFERLKSQAEAAIAQVDDTAVFTALDPEANSIAVLMQHVGGNLRSRWTDVFTTDGEKPDRNRDAEFEMATDTGRAAVEARWQAGWAALSSTLACLTPADLDRTVEIRNEPHSLLGALQRSLTHTAAHVGQLVLLAKHAAGTGWRTLSIPRGGSAEFNARMAGKP